MHMLCVHIEIYTRILYIIANVAFGRRRYSWPGMNAAMIAATEPLHGVKIAPGETATTMVRGRLFRASCACATLSMS